jgi:inorganic pyrophosphatase
MASATLPTRGGYEPKATEKFTARRIGAPNTLEHRIYIEKDGVPLSPFHDIPLYANEQQSVLNMIVEIPRWTNAKQEVRLYIQSLTARAALFFHMTRY